MSAPPPPPYHDEPHVGYVSHRSAMNIGRLSDEDLAYNEQIHLREEMALLKFKEEKEKEQKKEEKEFKKVAQQFREKYRDVRYTQGQVGPDFRAEINIKKLQEITDDIVVGVMGNLLITRNGVFVLDYASPRIIWKIPVEQRTPISFACAFATTIRGETDYHESQKEYDPIIRPLYTFSKPLSVSYIEMLSSSEIFRVNSHPSMCGSESGVGYMWSVTPSSILKRFETVMRIVPGSYKNGGWKQLDGFYGVYYNEAKMELSGIPPPIEDDE